MQAFEYIIIWNPQKVNNTREKAKIIKETSLVLASSRENATILAAREIPKEFLDKLDEVQVAVRSF